MPAILGDPPEKHREGEENWRDHMFVKVYLFKKKVQDPQHHSISLV